jgi:hypothetical protein
MSSHKERDAMARIGKNQLVKLQNKYRTDAAIGSLYNISRQAVHQLRIKYDMPPVPSKRSDRNDEIRRAYAGGVTGVSLAKKYALSLSQVYRIVSKHSPKRSDTGRSAHGGRA